MVMGANLRKNSEKPSKPKEHSSETPDDTGKAAGESSSEG
jgi:hypothetical protein